MHQGLHWEKVLWAAGHRVTRQRALILDAVCAGEGHTPLSEIYVRVHHLDHSIDRSTVYRALHLFIGLGLVLVANTGNGETCYEIKKPQSHHHLICRQCGKEQEIGDPVLGAMFAEVSRQYGFRISTDHLVLFGLCADCLEVEGSPKSILR